MGAVAIHAGEACPAETLHRPTSRSWEPSIEALTQSLQPSATSTWEVLEAIHDSGASVSVILQQVRRECEVVPGEAALAGVRYEIADGNEIQSLNETVMSIMTVDASWRRL